MWIELSLFVLTLRLTVSSDGSLWLSHEDALLAGALFAMVLLPPGLFTGNASHASDVPAGPMSVEMSVEMSAPVLNTERPDTLDVVVDAGSPVILSLPSSVRDRPVQQYRLVEPPSLASVADRSLLWVTRPENTGSHTLRILARHADPPADTLIVRVEVRDRS